VRVAQRVLGMIEQRQDAIRREAHPCGTRLFAGKPKHLRRRFRCWWNARPLLG
jgi:hypothetical protein